MHAALLLLATVLPGDKPVRVEDDIAPPGPLDLRGRWEGSWTRSESTDSGISYQVGSLGSWWPS
jgi:hypothetical protein